MNKNNNQDEEMFGNCEQAGVRPTSFFVEIFINNHWKQTSGHKNRYTAKINADTKAFKHKVRVIHEGVCIYEKSKRAK